MNVCCSLKGQKAGSRSTYLLSPTIPDPDYDSGKDSDSRESDGKESSNAWDSDDKGSASLRRGEARPDYEDDRQLWSSEGRRSNTAEKYDTERKNRYDSDRRSSEEKEVMEEVATERRRLRKEGKKKEKKEEKVEEVVEEERRIPVKGQERRESSSSGTSR